jgi:threonine/homoserine/homoserine lactone efflux protein
MLQVFFAVVALVAASVHLGFSAKRRGGPATIVGTYLIYLLFIYVGLMGLFTAYCHVFRPLKASASIGWASGWLATREEAPGTSKNPPGARSFYS